MWKGSDGERGRGLGRDSIRLVGFGLNAKPMHEFPQRRRLLMNGLCALCAAGLTGFLSPEGSRVLRRLVVSPMAIPSTSLAVRPRDAIGSKRARQTPIVQKRGGWL